jgi:hypothetical protein
VQYLNVYFAVSKYMCSVCYHELEWALSIQLLQTTVAELQANKKELIAAVVCMLTTVGLNLLEVS